MIAEECAVELAEAFIADRRAECRCGKRVRVYHLSAESFEAVLGVPVRHGSFHVCFEYDGPPTPPRWKGLVPAFDSPTTVEVNDRTGRCRILQHL